MDLSQLIKPIFQLYTETKKQLELAQNLKKKIFFVCFPKKQTSLNYNLFMNIMKIWLIKQNKTTKVFGTTSFSLTVEGMGPYPLSDSTNLLGPTTSLAGSSTCYTNYGTNAYSTPNPMRKCYYDYNYDRDNFRRHSAHGRMCRCPQVALYRLLNVSLCQNTPTTK